MINDSFRAMGTDVQISIQPTSTDSNRKISHAIDNAKQKMYELETLLSRFLPESEISQLNHKPGQWLEVHPYTLEILTIAKDAYSRTKGLFNPCLGGVMENIGYNVSFHEIKKKDSHSNMVFYVPFIPPTHCPYELCQETGKVLLEPNFKIDLGGIAKGWIVQQASKELQSTGVSQFLCNAGGDMICRGTNGDLPWCVGIANPDVPGSEILNLDISNLSVATSGTYRRKWSHDGETVHHIIDPFFGRPVRSDIVSCTVIHKNLAEAEVLAKTALILGQTNGQKWLNKQGTQGWIMIKNSGEVIHSWNS